MPIPIASFRSIGIASMIISRRPVRTRTEMSRPSITITPIASGQVEPELPDERERHERVEPEAGGDRERVLARDAHRQRHDAGGERRHRQHLRERQGGAGVVRDRAEDGGVQEQDVGHRQPRRDAGEDLDAHRGAALGDLEEAVEPARFRRVRDPNGLAFRGLRHCPTPLFVAGATPPAPAGEGTASIGRRPGPRNQPQRGVSVPCDVRPTRSTQGVDGFRRRSAADEGRAQGTGADRTRGDPAQAVRPQAQSDRVADRRRACSRRS